MLFRILVVEDSPVLRNIVETTLGLIENTLVSSVPNGREALDLLEICAVELVVTSIEMPGMDGRDLLTSIMLLPAPRPQVVIISNGNKYLSTDILALGAQSYFDKTDVPGLIRHVRAMVEAAGT